MINTSKAFNNQRILLIAPQPFYEDRGTPIAIRNTLNVLSDLGFKVDLATFPVGTPVDIPNVRVIRTVNLLGYKTVPVGLSLRKVVLDLFLIVTILRLACRNTYACVHGVEEGAAIGLLCKVLFGRPMIYDMQSSIPEQLQIYKWLKVGPGRWLSLLFERWLIRSADCIIASRGLAPYVHSIESGKTVFEFSFIGQDPRPRNEALARSLGVSQRPTVLYTGTFAPYQGLEGLIESAAMVQAEIPEVVFVLVGGIGDEIARLTRLKERYNLVDTVKLLPRQPREKIPDYLALADALVLPRISGENAPLKIYEYLRCKIPIVATNIPAHMAMLSDKTAIIVAPNSEDISRGILQVLRNSTHASKVAMAAHSFLQTCKMKSMREVLTEAYCLVS